MHPQGVEHIKLRGRLSILLCPLTNILPLVRPPLSPLIPTEPLMLTDTTTPDWCCPNSLHQPALPHPNLHRRSTHCQPLPHRQGHPQSYPFHHFVPGRTPQPLPRQARPDQRLLQDLPAPARRAAADDRVRRQPRRGAPRGREFFETIGPRRAGLLRESECIR